MVRAKPRRMRTKGFLLLLPLVLLACGSPQRPATFITSAKVDSGVDIVGRTLAAEGHNPTNVDRQMGLVVTEWKDTGFLFGQTQSSPSTPATIVRRFTIILAPSGQGANVTVRMDAKRCTQGAFKTDGKEVEGSCEELTVLPGSFQEEIDKLGAKVQKALGAPPPAQASAH
jgi:hypothetical protein